MDPLSLTASVIAIVGLADRIAVLVRAFRQAGKAAPSELTELSLEISTLRLILERLQQNDALERTDRKPGELTDIQVTMKNCDDAVLIAQRKVRDVERLLRGGTIDKVVFVFSSSSFRQEFKDLVGRLERSKTSLLLILQLINMDGWKLALEAATQAAAAGNSPLPTPATTLCEDTDTDDSDESVDEHPSHDLDGALSTNGAATGAASSELTTHASIGGWLSTFRPSPAPPN